MMAFSGVKVAGSNDFKVTISSAHMWFDQLSICHDHHYYYSKMIIITRIFLPYIQFTPNFLIIY